MYYQISSGPAIDEQTWQNIEQHRAATASQQQVRSYAITILFQQTGIVLLLFAIPFVFVIYQNLRVYKRLAAKIAAFQSFSCYPAPEPEKQPNFTQNLLEANPDLTAKDLELCALLRRNIDSKTIASRFNISPSSVYTARYRLRKKLDINTDEDLVAFLLQFTEK